MQYIRRTGCIQFDPLNKVGRNPDLVLQSRIKNYRPEMLEDLLYQERSLLDGWDKNMSIYSRSDWPCFARYRERARERLGDPAKPAAGILPRVRQDLRERGPLSSLDLKYDRVVDWSWAPTRLARAALESMYSWGELIVHHKVGTRKVYDFADRHLPAGLLAAPDPNPSEEEYWRWRVLRRIGGIGLVRARSSSESTWLGIAGLNSKKLRKTVAELLKADLVRGVQVEGLTEPLYYRTLAEPVLTKILSADCRCEKKQQVSFIAPLDNLLWDRELIKTLFGFEYVWEVYKPRSERKYGYYVLPVLYGERFIARFEPVLEKKTGMLRIKNWWWEKGAAEPGEAGEFREALKAAFREFQEYLGAVSVDTSGLDGQLLQGLSPGT